MKELLTRKCKFKYDENIALAKQCSVNLTILCFINPLNIAHALCGLGASINLMPLSMTRKPNKLTLTLFD